MNRITTILLLLHLSLSSYAQVVTGMEYFWDTDSGVAIVIAAVDGDWDGALERAIASDASTPSSEGEHTLNVRTKNKDGWGEVLSFSIYIEAGETISVTPVFNGVTLMEFYWDSDEGSAVQLTAEDGNWESALESAIASSVTTPSAAGHHSLNVRTKGLTTWGEVSSFPI